MNRIPEVLALLEQGWAAKKSLHIIANGYHLTMWESVGDIYWQIYRKQYPNPCYLRGEYLVKYKDIAFQDAATIFASKIDNAKIRNG